MKESEQKKCRIRKWVLWPLLVLFLWGTMCGATVFAQEDGWEEMYREQMEASGAERLPEALPEETRELLEKWGNDRVQPDAVLTLSPEDIMESLLQLAQGNLREPMQAALAVLGVLLICAVMQGMGGISGETESTRVFRIVCVTAMAVVLLRPVQEIFSAAGSVLQGVPVFLGVFVPVYVGVMIAAGQSISAGAYSALTVGAAEGAAVLFSSVLLPGMKLYLALSAVFAATRQQLLSGLGGWMRKTVQWILGISMSLFVSILALQSAVGAAADSLAGKALKFVIGSTVPVVGGELNEALNSVRGSLHLLKNSVGAFGILAGAAIFIPILVRVTVWKLVLGLCAGIGDLTEQKELAEFLRTVSGVLGLLSALLLCCAVFLILSTGILMAVKSGG